MKKQTTPKNGRLLLCLTVIACVLIGSCQKDTLPKTDTKGLLSKIEKKTLLSNKSNDLSTRLDAVKKEFYARKLDTKFAPKDDKSIIWTPEWSDPMIQTVNDSVSYVFYRLMPSVKREGKIFQAQEAGAASYIMVKNEKEFYKAFFYLPADKRSKKPSDDSPEFIMKNFTGKLLLSNIESKQSFLLDYKNGGVSDDYNKDQSAFKKLQSVGGAVSYYETQCRTEMVGCTYTTYMQDCGGQFIVEYSWSCQVPSYCSNSLWTLTDYSIQEVCEQVWFPDPPTDPGTGGTGGDDGVNQEDPGEDYEFTFVGDSINLSKRLECFENLPTNANTLYSVKICTDIPVNSEPKALLHNRSPGHAFIELTKTTNGVSVTQTIGFYPKSSKKATYQGSVPSMVVDNAGHPYDASLIKMLNVNEFNTMLAATLVAADHEYQMTRYNCTQFALDVFNSQGYTISMLNSISPSVYRYDYGKTPNGLYKNIKDKYDNQYPGASTVSGAGATSTNCN